MTDLNTKKVAECLSALAGEPVELISRSTSERTYYFVLPVRRSDAVGQAPTPFWRAVRESKSQGAWASAEEAVVFFSAHAPAWRSSNRKDEVRDSIRAMLADGPKTASDVLRCLASRGVSRDRANRAARRLGVLHTKAGMSGGWVWRLPQGQGRAASL